MAAFSDGSPEPTVRFLVEGRDGTFHAEPLPGTPTVGVTRYRRIRGQVEIGAPGRSPVAPEDELVPLMVNLCRAAATLAGAEHAVVGLTDSYGYLRMDREGAWLRLSGDGLGDLRVAGGPALGGVLACADRFCAWLPSLALEGDAGVAVESVQSERRRAAAALANAPAGWQPADS